MIVQSAALVMGGNSKQARLELDSRIVKHRVWYRFVFTYVRKGSAAGRSSHTRQQTGFDPGGDRGGTASSERGEEAQRQEQNRCINVAVPRQEREYAYFDAILTESGSAER